MEDFESPKSQTLDKETKPEDQVINNLDILLARYAKESVFEKEDKKKQITSIDRSISSVTSEYSNTLNRVLQRYGCEVDIEKIGNGLFRIPIPHEYIIKKLPEGYGYVGGAARAALFRILGLDDLATPRDVDIVRVLDQDILGLDDQLAAQYSEEDYTQGHGVQELGLDYFKTRDFTLNEVLVYKDWVYLTKECLLDTVRGILRFTEYEQNTEEDPDGMGVSSKLLAKAVRLASEEVVKNKKFEIENKEIYEFRNIKPFHLALHLDRAFFRGEDVAAEYVRQLISLYQLPESVKDPLEAADFLLEGMHHPYVFQYAPKTIMQTDSEIDEMYHKFGELIEKYEN